MIRYRYPNEQLILAITMIAVLVITLVAAGPTLCLAPLFFIIMLVLSYQMNKTHHQALFQEGLQVSPKNTPELDRLVRDCVNRLRPGAVQIFIVPQRQLNAYTFGLSDPKVIVLFSPLLKAMDEDELRFIIGHEMGHVALRHAWLNTLLGGMAGVPVPFSAAVALTLAFRWWNRICEYSADRAGLLACGNPNKAISALIKLVAGQARTPADLQRALALIEKEDDSPLNVLAETLSTHPMIVRRIKQLQRYAATQEYRALQAQVLRTSY